MEHRTESAAPAQAEVLPTLIDNRQGNRLLEAAKRLMPAAQSVDIATGYFEVGALVALDGAWQEVSGGIRLLMGDEMTRATKAAIVEGLSDHRRNGIEQAKIEDDWGAIDHLRAIREAIASGKILPKVYTRAKFHAKSMHYKTGGVANHGIIGSSNFTRRGMTENIELNLFTSDNSQLRDLEAWFERAWEEAEDIQADLLKIIEPHVRDYSPFEVYLRAMRERFFGLEPGEISWEREESRIYRLLAQYQRDAYHGDRHRCLSCHQEAFVSVEGRSNTKVTGREAKGRKPGRYKWYEIQDEIAYYAEFDKPKIVYPQIMMESRFTLDRAFTYTNQKCFIICLDDPLLLGLLNSRDVWWFLATQVVAFGDADNGGRIEPRKEDIESIPIPRASDADRDAIAALVQKCLDAKAADPAADVSQWEAEIDARVEFLYFHRGSGVPPVDTYDEWLAKRGAEKGTIIEDVRKLLATGHELDVLEFKSSFSWDLKKQEHADWLKDEVHTAICAMLNAKGGDLLIGVNDSGTILGLCKDLERYGGKDKLIQAVESPLGKTLTPNPIGLVDIKAVDIDGQTILRIQVRPDNTERYRFKGEIYVRRNSRSKPALTPDEAASWWPKRQRGEV